MASPADCVADFSSSSSPCRDLAAAIYNTKNVLLQSRAEGMEILNDLKQGLAWNVTRGKFFATLGEVEEASQRTLEWSAGYFTAKVSLDILTGLYSAHGCWSHDWQDASVSRGGWVLQCEWEVWEIYWDGGDVELEAVQICNYVWVNEQ